MESAANIKPKIKKLSRHVKKMKAKLDDWDANMDVTITSSEAEADPWATSDEDTNSTALDQASGSNSTALGAKNSTGNNSVTSGSANGADMARLVKDAVAAAMTARDQQVTEQKQFAGRKQEWTIKGEIIFLNKTNN